MARSSLIAVCVGGFVAAFAGADEPAAGPGVRESNVALTAAGGRAVPARLFTPADGCEACPLIVFSHGAFATYDRYDVLLHAWAAGGHAVIAPLHVDSEEHPERDAYDQNATLGPRLEDYAVAAALAAAGEDETLPDGVTLSGETIAAGHSYGALIAQMAAGATVDASVGVAMAEDAAAPLAVIAISPPGPLPDYVGPDNWAAIAAPMLVVTGTEDVLPNFVPEWELHLVSYEAAPAGLSYALVFEGMDHYFNGAFGRPTPEGEAARPAVAQLNDAILAFISAARGAGPPHADEWSAMVADGVEAMSR
ncbi:MAG: hypothetical protein MI723_11575 [Caulobacterales bacterium]|nr:hypothetical protein [Caulobacterales bacterium]